MNTLSELKPYRHDLIMDVVGAAGVDVSDWVNSRKGASNPKYCYEWAFADDTLKNIVLCLWFEDCSVDADGSVVQRGNMRPVILKLEGQGTPRARRARRFDELLQLAWRQGSTIRVALVDRSEDAKRRGEDQERPQAELRQLDPAEWRLVSYEMMTGEYVLRRMSGEGHSHLQSSGDDVEGQAPALETAEAHDEPATAGESASMQMDYVCRIVFSDNGWIRPAAAFKEAADSYASTRGFGHEEWLFRSEWAIGGWRYAFLQGINDSYERLCKERRPFSITLFTIDPRLGHRYVARMFGVEVLDPADALRAVEEFRRRGWLDSMREEIAAVGGRSEALGNDALAVHILNFRYRIDRVERLSDTPVAMQDDPVRRITRYTLCSSKNVGVHTQVDLAEGHEPRTAAYFRNGTEPLWVTPEHGAIQTKLREELHAEYPDATVRCEVGGVDVLVETAGERILFEVKSELCTRRVIREALGQVMEYAYYRPREDAREVRLVLVGRSPATESDAAYLSLLRSSFGIPVDYRQVEVPPSLGPLATS